MFTHFHECPALISCLSRIQFCSQRDHSGTQMLLFSYSSFSGSGFPHLLNIIPGYCDYLRIQTHIFIQALEYRNTCFDSGTIIS